ncbi:MAG: hypothetical protein H5U21_00495 [Porphyrobacter sp.]|nr:hypothetical protein [Porphyrobacter sp.]
MRNCAEEALVVAKIVSLGAVRDSALDDEFSLWFEVDFRGKGYSFQIPAPLCDGGYTSDQLEAIEVELQKLGLDLLPLDHNLVQ